jgi:hypothetical protein
LSEKCPDVTVVAYPPIIDAKPNDMATVYTAMKKCLDMTNEAGHENPYLINDITPTINT